jgi:hypothetical protein
MSFDSSRFTFDPWNNFSGVVMQQGRVQLDSDWNEWLAEFARRIRAGTLDTLGRAAVPLTTKTAFQIVQSQDASGNISIDIGPGRMYVDGLQAENHGLPAPNPQKWIPAGGAPSANTSSLSASSLSNRRIGRLPLNQVWDSALDELEGQTGVNYNGQPYYPNAALLAPFPQSGGPYLVYLDVWQREVTFLQAPDLVEKAVGVDTTGRIQTVWQVKWLDVSSVAGVNCSTPDANLTTAWQNLLLPPGPRLTTGVVQSSPGGPCCLTPNTGFTGLENQLYRVEIHQPGGLSGSGSAATFKWSRNHASWATVVSAIAQSGTVLTVQSTGKDNSLRFSPNDWVEITDDWLELNGLPGELHQVSEVDDAARTITLSSAVSPTSFPVNATGLTDPSRHTRLTRWDQSGKVFESDGVTAWVDLNAPGSSGDIPVPPPGTTLILEDGVTVLFDLVPNARNFHTGDNWAFAARATDGTVEFLAQAPPQGIYHHCARLAAIIFSSTRLSGQGTLTLQDLSQPPVAFLNFLATPTAAWPANFEVATRANGVDAANFDLEVIYNPAAGQGVALPVTVESFTNLSLDPAAPNFAPSVLKASNFVSVPGTFVPPSKTPVFSNAFSPGIPLPGTGTFQLTDTSAPPIPFLTLQTNAPANWPQNFAVSASPFGTSGNFNLEVVYAAPGAVSIATLERFTNLSPGAVASQVNSQFITHLASPLTAPFPPLNLISLTDCRTFWPPTSGLAPPALHVTATSWANDSILPLGTFLQGLRITLDGAPTGNSVTSSTVIVTLEAPMAGQTPGFFLSEIIAGTPVINAGTNIISWTPPAGFGLPALAAAAQFRVRVTLKGHFIWTKSATQLVYLDGQAFGQLDGKRADGTTMTSLVLPSGAGARASDFESWFFLVPSIPLQFTLSAAAPTLLRGEGLTELVADILLTGTGGTPTPAGVPVPLVNITVMLNTNATSRLFSVTPPALLDAVLMIDEPSSPPGTGKLNTAPTNPAPAGVGGNGIDFKDGLAPNVIVGNFNQSAPNQVTFLGVPVDPPGNGSRILRITNLRVNATATSGTGLPVQVVATVSTSVPASLPILNPGPVTIGSPNPSTGVSVISTSAAGTFTINPSAGVNPGLVTNPAGTGAIDVMLQFVGAMAGAFKPRTANQSFVPGTPYTSEESFDGAGLSLVPGVPALNVFMGRADQGTQFVARFLNVPQNVQIFVTTRDLPPGGLQNNDPDTPPAQAVLVLPAGNGKKTPGGVPLGTGGKTSGQIAGIPIELVPVQAANAEAVWEWVGPPQPNQIQTLQFGVVLAMAQNATLPAPVTASVRLSLGPLSTVNTASQSDPVPRFADLSAAINLFTVL